ncbi:MAG TPA: isocitrate/isopropylmalate dehydrogenase family protein [Euryarchaeota archaeon]|nr:isocitrate/isopropylmalate dehydrogenase family protein [Euryarchaeota archaeon]
MAKHKITLIPGDGIGPEVTDAAVTVLEATGVKFEWEKMDAGEAAIKQYGTPLPEMVLDSLRKNKVGLKGPVTTPIGSGFRSVNVAMRQTLDLYACVRPARSIAGVGTLYRDIDLVIVREATEGLYSGVEHWVDREHSAAETVNIITRKNSERIVRYAFEYARREGRKKITAVHKANIMKCTGSLFQDISREVAAEYPDIEFEERLVDNMCMQLVKKPNLYDVIVTTNLFGDIISDLTAGLSGGLGVAPGGNIGDEVALFEPVHGSAPKYAGQNKVNPVAEILSGEMLLRHIGEKRAADRVWKAVCAVIEEKKVLTYDLALAIDPTGKSVKISSLSEMAEEIAGKVENM